MATAKDPKLQADLQAQLDKAGQETTENTPKVSVSGEFRRADGVWRDAEHRYQQSVSNVVRLRSNLAAAEAKEKAAAMALAEAADAELQAAQAVAKAEGVQVGANAKTED